MEDILPASASTQAGEGSRQVRKPENPLGATRCALPLNTERVGERKAN